jgi:hypothetical protein
VASDVCFIVRLDAPDSRSAEHYVGPFADLRDAQRYRDRLEQSSNGRLRAEIAPLTAP